MSNPTDPDRDFSALKGWQQEDIPVIGKRIPKCSAVFNSDENNNNDLGEPVTRMEAATRGQGFTAELP